MTLSTLGVFTATRAEYGLLVPLLQALQACNDFTFELYVSGSHLTDIYGKTIEEIEKDGFSITKTFVLPEMGGAMAVGCGAITEQVGAYLHQKSPQLSGFIVLGDRYETLGASLAAFLNTIPLIHLHGGDVVRGGMLDDPIRHAITKLAHIHFPATQLSAQRILAMGEEPWRVTVMGSPAVDNIRTIPKLDRSFFVEKYGLDPQKPWVLFTQHPLTSQSHLAGEHARETLDALTRFGEELRILATYPNHDAGSPDIIQHLETIFAALPQFRVVKSLGRVQYLNLLPHLAFMIGNSSSGLLESAHFGVPCLNIGLRQHGRERGKNVLDVAQDPVALHQAIDRILHDPDYRQSLQSRQHPFGDGHSAEKVVDVLRRDLSRPDLLNKQLMDASP